MSATQTVQDRYKHLDSAVTTLSNRVTGVETKLDNHGAVLTQLASGMREIQAEIAKQGKLNPQLLLGVISAAVAVLTVGGVVVSMALSPLGEKITAVNEKLADHMADEDHPGGVSKRVESNAARLDASEKLLASEIKHLATLFDARIATVEQKAAANADHLKGRDGLRFNMPDYERLIATRITRIEDLLDDVRTSRWTMAEGVESRERLTALEAKVAGIEKQQDQRRSVIDKNIADSAALRAKE